MSKVVKSLMLKDLSDKLQDVTEAFFVDISKLDGIANNRLRAACRQQSISILFTRYTLAKCVLNDRGWRLGDSQVSGATTLAWGSDVVRLAREALRWETAFPGAIVKGGYLGGQIITLEDVKVLSQIPSKEELLGRIVAGLSHVSCAPIGAINAPAAALASQIQQLSEREQN